MYKIRRFTVGDVKLFENKSIRWADQFPVFNHFSGNKIQYPYHPFKNILFAGIYNSIASNENSFEKLRQFYLNKKSWVTGFITYDIKNELEKLSSDNIPYCNYPHLFFYQPQVIIFFEEKEIIIHSIEIAPDVIFRQIESVDLNISRTSTSLFHIENYSEKDYINTLKKIKSHIIDGDIYELNYCFKLSSDNVIMDPVNVHYLTKDKYPAPFSVFQKYYDQYSIGYSPERFMKKSNHKIISQPIKGTSIRDSDLAKDAMLKEALRNNPKEQAENLMIVDLVRNDLAKSSIAGSVKVEELYGIYSFQVHQMISTITSTINYNLDWVEVIKNAFPMGSMTGAPKIKSMELIEQYEDHKRGLFSGSIGYVDPEENFDFNVVIRTLFYNKQSGNVSFLAGSAITFDADPQKEFEECLLKAGFFFDLAKGNF